MELPAALVLMILCGFGVISHSQAQDHQGTRFILSYMVQYQALPASRGNCDVVITSLRRATVRIQIPFLSYDRQVDVIPGDSTINRYRFPASLRTGLNRLENKGVLITSDVEISVYAFNAGFRTGESYLALPMTSFNTSFARQEFIVPAYDSLRAPFRSNSLVGVVASDNDTQVEIIPTMAGGGHNFSAAVSATINEFQTYQYAITGDTTGYLVRSNKPLSVYGGTTCSFVPATVQYCDMLVEQIPPTYTWGTDFFTGPIRPRITGDVFRVLASQDDTTFTTGTLRATLNRGQFYEFQRSSSSLNYMQCSKPCLLVQYNKGRSADNIRIGSDPFMMIIPPVQQYTDQVIVAPFKTLTERDYSNYMNIIAQKRATGGLTVNGATIPRSLWFDIPNTDYAITMIRGLVYREYLISHWAPNVKWQAWAYGHLDVEAYGHPVGLGMKSDFSGAIPTVPATTVMTTTPVYGNFTEKCDCTVRLEANFTAGETEPTEVLYRLDPIWFNNTKGRCFGCEEVMDQCRLRCDQNIRDLYSPDGLYKPIPINGTGGVRFRPLGQVLCEEYLDDLPPPGVRLVAYYEPGSCGQLFHTTVNQQGLCCKEVDIPEIGFVVVWDAQCDGNVEFPFTWPVKHVDL